MGDGGKIANDPDKIDEAAKNVVSEPLAYMDLAKQYVDKACDLHFLAFGVIGSAILGSAYHQSWQDQKDNLQGGVDKIKELGKGLSYVAANYRNAESANDPVGRKVDVSYTEPKGGDNSASFTEGAILAAGLELLPTYIGVATALGASSALAPTAIGATVAWALFTPDDDAVHKAIGGWGATSTQLGAVGLDDALKPLDEGWTEGDALQAFNNWKTRFLTEIEQAKGAADKNKEALEKVLEAIEQVQTDFFIFAALSLAAIIAYTVLEKVPYIGPIAAVLKQLQGALVAVGAVGAVGAIVWILQEFVGPLKELWAGRKGFAELEVNAGGGNTFKDIQITWDDPYQQKYEHK